MSRRWRRFFQWSEMRVRLIIPKGHLFESTLEVLKLAGIASKQRAKKSLYTETTDPEVDVIFLRSIDIPKFVEGGAADLGITGHDCVVESESDVEELLDLEFGKVDIVMAAREDSDIRAINDIKPKTRVATRFVNIARRYFEGIGKQVSIIRVSGAVEVIPYLGVADLVIEITETGTTLGIHGLRVIDAIHESSARLIANRRSLTTKKAKIEEIVIALRSVIRARMKKLVMMNVPGEALKGVIEMLPAMSGPTVARVEGPEVMWEVYSVVNEEEVYKVINRVKKAGARDIIVVPIERVVK